MKHFWIGVVALILLVAAGAGLTYAFTSFHDPLAQQLYQAAELARQEQLPQARQLAADANKAWQARRHFSASIADHELLEEMDELFAQLETAQTAREVAAVCSRLAAKSAAMADAQKLTWWNIL